MVRHLYTTVRGRRMFYREAGAPEDPVIVLLHGYPTSSFMFRELIPRLARHHRVIAPDHLGFGLSDAPPVEEFDYTFDALAGHTADLIAGLGVTRYAIYVQDYGAPIGWRLAIADPGAITAVVSQSGNAYDVGFVEEFWAPVWAWGREQDAATEAAIRPALSLEAIRWQYTHGVTDVSTVSPDTWFHDHALVSRPGNDRIQLQLFADYVNNPPLYPALHRMLRESGVPVLAVWGRHDRIFDAAGAQAFLDDAPDAEIHLLDGGHFLLESALDRTEAIISSFLHRHLGPGQVTASASANA